MTARRIAVLFDFAEEDWRSMDLVAEMLVRELESQRPENLVPTAVRPRFRRRLSRLSSGPARELTRLVERGLGGRELAPLLWNADRLANRLVDYPLELRRLSGFDLHHVADHSYAHLVHGLPPERTGVYCHDLDAFRSVLEPAREARPAWFRALARRALEGMAKAAVVFHSTDAVRAELERLGVVDPRRLVKAPYGVADEYREEPDRARARAALPEAARESEPFVLHVGSCIPRKRVDVLLDVFAELRRALPELRLVQIGGVFTGAQRARIAELGLEPAVLQLPRQPRSAVAALYQRARLTLIPSEAEGFGLPVVEALASGGLVLASDIPPLREVGGNAAVYCPVGDVASFARAARSLLEDPASGPSAETRRLRAAEFSWSAHASTIARAYARIDRGEFPS